MKIKGTSSDTDKKKNQFKIQHIGIKLPKATKGLNQQLTKNSN